MSAADRGAMLDGVDKSPSVRLGRYICTLRKAGSIAANTRGAFDTGRRAAADP